MLPLYLIGDNLFSPEVTGYTSIMSNATPRGVKRKAAVQFLGPEYLPPALLNRATIL